MERSQDPQTAPSILIVDDNAEARRLLSLLLQAEGYHLLVARDGHEALRIVDRVPDLALVVLDVMMPGMDGLEVCRRIRKRDDGRYLPVILTTALSEPEQVASGLAAGADDYVSKPFAEAEVLARVRATLRVKRASDALVEAHKLATAGAMAVTLGHEINNPLTTVIGNLELALHNEALDERSQRNLAAALEAANSIRELVRRLVSIKQVVTTDYIDSVRMLDLDASCPPSQPHPPASPAAEEAKPQAAEDTPEPPAPEQRPEQDSPAGQPAAEAAGDPPEASADPSEAAVFDKDAALARAGGDETLLCAAVELFLGDCEALLPEIDRAVASGDLAGLERAAHRIKGAAVSLSAASAADAAAHVERLARRGHLEQAPAAADGLKAELARLRPRLVSLAGRPSP